jgi:hypothetical protein
LTKRDRLVTDTRQHIVGEQDPLAARRLGSLPRRLLLEDGRGQRRRGVRRGKVGSSAAHHVEALRVGTARIDPPVNPRPTG